MIGFTSTSYQQFNGEERPVPIALWPQVSVVFTQTLDELRDEHVFSHLSILERLCHVFFSSRYESVAGLEQSKVL